MTVTIINLSSASVKSSLLALATNRKPRIPEYLLAESILKSGCSPSPLRSQIKAAACA